MLITMNLQTYVKMLNSQSAIEAQKMLPAIDMQHVRPFIANGIPIFRIAVANERHL